MKTAKGFRMAIVLMVGAAWMLSFAPLCQAQALLRVGQRAPEITGGPWINSAPLSMEKLRGRVVYVEFWTYG